MDQFDARDNGAPGSACRPASKLLFRAPAGAETSGPCLGKPPRSSVIAITRQGGGMIA